MRIDLNLEFEKLQPLSNQTRSHYGNNQWTGTSPKLGRKLLLQSDLEYDHWLACVESDPSIIYFCEHPLRVHLKVDGKDIATIFDMAVQHAGGEWELREVKYKEQLENDEHAIIQTTAQRMWCALHDIKYRIMTEREIRHNPLWIQNWKTIVAYLNTANRLLLQRHSDDVLRAIAAHAPIALNSLQNLLAPLNPQLVAAVVFELIHRGECTAPLDSMSVNGLLVVRTSRV